MRILHIHKYFHDRDGASKYELSLITKSQQLGHDTAVLAMRSADNFPSPWEKYFLDEIKSDRGGLAVSLRQLFRAFWSVEAYQKTRAIIADFKPDIIHLHNIYTHLSPAVIFAARDCNIPMVMTVHDYALCSANYALWDEKNNQPLTPPVSIWKTAQTKFIKDSFLRTFALDLIFKLQHLFGWYQKNIFQFLTYSYAARAHLIASGFEARQISVVGAPIENKLLATHNLAPSERRGVIFVGRIESYKGIDLITKLAALLPQVPFAIVGSGSQFGDLQAASSQLPNLTIYGHLSRPQVYELLSRSRVALVPSLWPEPFGLVALEAMALGTPVIVSDQGGLKEIPEPNLSGFVLSPSDLKSWASAIKTLVNDDSAFASLSQSAQARAKQIGEENQHYSKIVDIYRQAVDKY